MHKVFEFVNSSSPSFFIIVIVDSLLLQVLTFLFIFSSSISSFFFISVYSIDCCHYFYFIKTMVRPQNIFIVRCISIKYIYFCFACFTSQIKTTLTFWSFWHFSFYFYMKTNNKLNIILSDQLDHFEKKKFHIPIKRLQHLRINSWFVSYFRSPLIALRADQKFDMRKQE